LLALPGGPGETARCQKRLEAKQMQVVAIQMQTMEPKDLPKVMTKQNKLPHRWKMKLQMMYVSACLSFVVVLTDIGLPETPHSYR
jgi:hypothetical protein